MIADIFARSEACVALEETAERGGIGITKVVTYLQYGQIRTGRKQILRLLSQILLNIIAGGNTHHLLDNYREMARHLYL